uniref:Metallo-beta-lactamase superfamily protein n=1 Tax=Trepomonas sp. PC1 TaxID=1076344 RepID=A0A146KFE5_9EUKA|eukprot:JAP94604.1 Metallo-beta-lactamase superfamily protein [Trepomonas sp. PC1]
MSVTRIDTKFLRGEFCGVFHVEHEGIHSIVEVGSTLSVPYIVGYLKDKQIGLDVIKNVFITHVHLDHSGGAGLLLQSLPNATIYTHSAGVTHIVNPHAKLVPGAVEVYGQETFDKDYPNIVGCDQSRVKAMKDSEIVDNFQCIEAHGHAYHHCMFLFKPLRYLFSGDGMGFGFKEINMCPLLCTSPTQFDFQQWMLTLQKIRQLDIDFIQPTHFDRFEKSQFEKLFQSVQRQLEAYQQIILTKKTKEEVKQAYMDVVQSELKQYNCDNVEKAYQMIYGDINFEGIWYRVTRLKK